MSTVRLGDVVLATFTTEKRVRRSCPAIVIGAPKGGLKLFLTEPDNLGGPFDRWRMVLPHKDAVAETADYWEVLPAEEIAY